MGCQIRVADQATQQQLHGLLHDLRKLRALLHDPRAYFSWTRSLSNTKENLLNREKSDTATAVDILAKIKRLAIARRLRFTFKADVERIRDGLSVEDIVESLVNAPAINKTLRSRSPQRLLTREKLYVIISSTYDGTLVYTKGTVRKTHGVEEYYLVISAKKDTV
jgi:hypothetical protein